MKKLIKNKNVYTKKDVLVLSKKLIAIDMDGTLLSSDHQISAVNKKAIKDAQAAGHIVMICSGRAHDRVLVTLEEEGLSGLPISASNGAVALVDETIIDRICMNRESAAKIYDWLDALDYPFQVFTETGFYRPEGFVERAKHEFITTPRVKHPHFNDLNKMEAYLKNSPATYITQSFDIPAEASVFKFYIYAPDMNKKATAIAFEKSIADLTITSSFEDNVEISDIKANKGTGLAVVANHFNIQMADTIAIGDNYNDLAMLEAAGTAVAMGNAEAGIKEISNFVTLTNDENGVAHAIDKYVLERA